MRHRKQEGARNPRKVSEGRLVDQGPETATSRNDPRLDVVLRDVAVAGLLSPDVVADELDEERVTTGGLRRARRELRSDPALGAPIAWQTPRGSTRTAPSICAM